MGVFVVIQFVVTKSSSTLNVLWCINKTFLLESLEKSSGLEGPYKVEMNNKRLFGTLFVSLQFILNDWTYQMQAICYSQSEKIM